MKVNILSVYIDDVPISPNQILELHLISSLDSLLYRCIMKIRDTSGVIESLIKFGTICTINYIDVDTKNIVLSCPLQILSFQKTATASVTLIDEFQITLISPYYFSQTPKRKAYYGSVSNIIQEVSAREPFFTKKSIEPSSDTPSLRYQLLISDYDFMSQIARYAVRDASAMFLYSTIERELILKSLTTIINIPATYTLIPLLDSKNEVTASLPNTLGMLAVAFYADGKQTNSTRSYLFNIAHTPADQIDTVKSSMALKTLQETEAKLVKFKSGASASIVRWDMPPHDAVSRFINYSARVDQELFSAIAIVPPLAGTGITLGSTFKIYMNDDRCPENGTYYVSYIDHQANEGILYSKLHLIRIAQQ